MDGKRRQYVPPTLGGSSATAAAVTAAADAAAKRLVRLRTSAPVMPLSPPISTSESIGTSREQALAEVRRYASMLSSNETSAVVLRSSGGASTAYSKPSRVPASSETVAAKFSRETQSPVLTQPFSRPLATSAPKQKSSPPFETVPSIEASGGDHLPTPTTSSHALSAPPSSSASSASVAAAAAAAALQKIRHHSTHTGADHRISRNFLGFSVNADALKTSSEVTKAPTVTTLPRPTSVELDVQTVREPAVEQDTRPSMPAKPISSPPASVGETVGDFHEVSRRVDDAPGGEAGLHSAQDASGRLRQLAAKPLDRRLKRPRDSSVPQEIVKDINPSVRDDSFGSDNEVHSSIVPIRTPASDNVTWPLTELGGREFGGTTSSTNPPPQGKRNSAQCDQPIPASATFSTSSPLHHFPRPAHGVPHSVVEPEEESDGEADETVEEEDDDVDGDGEGGGTSGRRSAVRSDPLRVVVAASQLERVEAASRGIGVPVDHEDRDAEADEFMMKESMNEDDELGASRSGGPAPEAQSPTAESMRLRRLLEDTETAHARFRATQAAASPPPPAELLLELLQQLPTSRCRAVYNPDDCPCAAADGFTNEFHQCVQRRMTVAALQRDGRIGSRGVTSFSIPLTTPSASSPLVSAPTTISASPIPLAPETDLRQPQCISESEQGGETCECRIDSHVRDVVAYARSVAEERLHQERRDESRRGALPPEASALNRNALQGVGHPSQTDIETVSTDGEAQKEPPRKYLMQLQKVVKRKLDMMRSAVPSRGEGDESEERPHAEAKQSGGNETKGSVITEAGATVLMALPSESDSAAALSSAHARFTSLVRSAAAKRQESLKETQLAEQRLEAAVAAWRTSFDQLVAQGNGRQQSRRERRVPLEPPATETDPALTMRSPWHSQRHQSEHSQYATADDPFQGIPKAMRKRLRRHFQILTSSASTQFSPHSVTRSPEPPSDQ